MPLRIQHHQSYRRPKKRKSPKYLVFLCLALLGLASYIIFAQSAFKKSETSADSAKNIIGKVVKKEPPKPTFTKEQAMAEIDTLLASSRGTFGYYVIDLKTNEAFGKNEDYSFTAASSIKVPFAVYVYSLIEKGGLSADRLWTYTSADYEGGTGNLIASPYGTKLTVARAVQLMIRVSDNAATNIITRSLGRSSIQSFFDNAGVTGIIVVKNKITPRAAATVLQGLYQGKYLSETSANTIFEHMKNSITPERIVAGVPSGVEVAHKIGTNVGAISDTAVVYHPDGAYVLTVYSDKAVGETEPSQTIANISKVVYKHFDSRE